MRRIISILVLSMSIYFANAQNLTQEVANALSDRLNSYYSVVDADTSYSNKMTLTLESSNINFEMTEWLIENEIINFYERIYIVEFWQRDDYLHYMVAKLDNRDLFLGNNYQIIFEYESTKEIGKGILKITLIDLDA